jgi:hypothetical protein
MSRRRSRGRPAPDAAPVQPGQQPAYSFSRPVQIDLSKLEIPDMKLFALAPQLAQDEAAAQAALPALIDLLERVVVGGLRGRPITEFWPLLGEVTRQLQQAGNPKN